MPRTESWTRTGGQASGLRTDRAQRPHLQPGTPEGRRTGEAPRKRLLPAVAWGEGGSPRREWSAGGGQYQDGAEQGGRTKPGGLWTEGLGSNPGLALLPTYHSRCSGVTSSSVAMTPPRQAGGRACKTSGQSRPEMGSPRDPTSSAPTSLPLNTRPFSKSLDGGNFSED